jgi:hypothetical protein
MLLKMRIDLIIIRFMVLILTSNYQIEKDNNNYLDQ